MALFTAIALLCVAGGTKLLLISVRVDYTSLRSNPHSLTASESGRTRVFCTRGKSRQDEACGQLAAKPEISKVASKIGRFCGNAGMMTKFIAKLSRAGRFPTRF
jgi:hypothetical protein